MNYKQVFLLSLFSALLGAGLTALLIGTLFPHMMKKMMNQMEDGPCTEMFERMMEKTLENKDSLQA